MKKPITLITAAILCLSMALPATAMRLTPGGGDDSTYDPDQYNGVGDFSWNARSLNTTRSPTEDNNYSRAGSMADFVDVQHHDGTSFTNGRTTGDANDVTNISRWQEDNDGEFTGRGTPTQIDSSKLKEEGSLDNKDYSQFGKGTEIIPIFNFDKPGY